MAARIPIEAAETIVPRLAKERPRGLIPTPGTAARLTGLGDEIAFDEDGAVVAR
jgi:hypothetical protein